MATQTGQEIEKKPSGLPPWPLGWRSLAEFVVAYLVLVAIGLAIGFALKGPLSSTAIGGFDRELSQWFAAQRTASLNESSNIGSGLANTFNVIAAVGVVVVFVTWRLKRWKESLTLATGLALEALTFLTVSLTVGRSRPPVDQLDGSPPTASFPSGHTGAAFAFFLGVALIVYWVSDRRWVRVVAVVVALIAALTVAVSRLYRGMHYLTDVTAGALLGVACLGLSAMIVQWAIDRRQRSEASL